MLFEHKIELRLRPLPLSAVVVVSGHDVAGKSALHLVGVQLVRCKTSLYLVDRL